MSKFMDADGREWVLRLVLGHRKPLAELGVGFDPTSFTSTLESFAGICDDAGKLVKACHLLASPKPEPGVLLEDAFDGATFAAASVALADEVIDFFLNGRPELARAAREMIQTQLTTTDREKAGALTLFVSETNSRASAG